MILIGHVYRFAYALMRRPLKTVDRCYTHRNADKSISAGKWELKITIPLRKVSGAPLVCKSGVSNAFGVHLIISVAHALASQELSYIAANR